MSESIDKKKEMKTKLVHMQMCIMCHILTLAFLLYIKEIYRNIYIYILNNTERRPYKKRVER